MSVPRLYPANEAAKSNAFQSLGIGALGDAISCTVTEERNGEFELEMEYPVDGLRFKDLENDRLIMAKASERGNEQIFRIYKIEKPIDGKVTVNAEHISYLLNKATCLPFEATSANSAFEKIKENLIWQANNANFPKFPFDFFTDNSTTGQILIETPKTIRTILGGEDQSILDVCKGEYEFDNFTVKLWKERGSDSNVYLRYGKNITDLTATDDISKVYTGIVPFWKGSLTRKTKDEDGNDTTESYETTVYVDGKVLWSDESKNFGYPMAVPVDMSSDIEVKDDTTDKDNPIYATEDDVKKLLQTQAESYLKNNKGWEPANNIEVSFTQLWQTEEYKNFAALQRVGMCDKVHVIYPKLNITTEMKVIKTVFNVLLDRYDKIELGEPKSSMSNDIAQNQTKVDNDLKNLADKTQSDLKRAAQEATDMINGKINNLAGAHEAYVVFNRNAKGGINEILIMDNPDKTKAVNVWRWNGGGLGHSHSGYNGPFDDVAITQDGKINANYITTGVLTAILFRTASAGKRIVIMDGDATVSGYQDDTLKSVIDMVNESGDMLIDSSNKLVIRAPSLWVEAASHGDGGSTVTQTKTGSIRVTDYVAKYGSWEPDGSDHSQQVQEVDFSSFSGYDVYCMLPVKLKNHFIDLNVVNGMITTTSTSSTSWY